jgi:hypothetical protein
MRRIVVSEFLTLDGVMQAPGDPNEDRSGGFDRGGWQLAYVDDIFGSSGELVQTLIRHDLVDAYRLMIHPLVLGTGKRLFRDDSVATKLRLVDSKPTTTGVLILTYEPEGSKPD